MGSSSNYLGYQSLLVKYVGNGLYPSSANLWRIMMLWQCIYNEYPASNRWVYVKDNPEYQLRTASYEDAAKYSWWFWQEDIVSQKELSIQTLASWRPDVCQSFTLLFSFFSFLEDTFFINFSFVAQVTKAQSWQSGYVAKTFTLGTISCLQRTEIS